MKVLLIGYGSIGRRHYSILSSISVVKLVDVVSKQNLEIEKTYKTLNDVENLNEYDYFVVASETYLHYEHLRYICSKVTKKLILVEKPLFDKVGMDVNTLSNQVFVAYNLRFHPVITKLKTLLTGEEIYFANVIAGQYLPTWRPSTDYTKSYSASIEKGGGVLRDLSHELDYINWLFGEIIDIKYINGKISDLKIYSDDIFTAIAVTNKKIIINVTLDYISKKPVRRMLIYCRDKTLEVDLVANQIQVYSDQDETFNITNNNINFTYTTMHEKIISQKQENCCTYQDGLKVVKLFDKSNVVWSNLEKR